MKVKLGSWLVAVSLLFGLMGCSDRKPEQANEVAVQGLYSGALAANGKFAVIGSIHHGGSLWQVETNERLFDWNLKADRYANLVAVDIDDEGRYAVTAEPWDLALWEVASGKPIDYRRAPAEILDVALSETGQLLAVGLDDRTAMLFDTEQGAPLQTFTHGGRVRAVALNQAKGLLLTGDDTYLSTLWDIKTGKKLHEVEIGNQATVTALSADGKLAFSASQLNKAVIWDTVTGQVKHTLASMSSGFERKATFTAARFIDQGQRLLTGTSSGRVWLWDTRTGVLEASWMLHHRETKKPVSVSVMSVSSLGANRHLALGSNGFVNQLSGP